MKLVLVKNVRYYGFRRGSAMLTLNCGHEVHRKQSQGIPKRARCRQCEFSHDEIARELGKKR